MTDAERDERLAGVLEQIEAGLRESGRIDLPGWQSRYPDLAPELPALAETLRALETAASACRAGGETPTPAAGDTGVWEHREEPAAPARVGRYEVVGRLGRGGMGTVYRAHDPQLRRDVAVKVPRFGGPPSARTAAAARFLREARSAAAVRHPHVCPIHDVGEQDGTPFVVMALAEGGSLAEFVAAGPAEPRRAADVVRRVAEGLSAVHAHGIVHRDIKPANVLLDRDGQPLLTDFGLARSESDAERLTADGALVGTPSYMAPEQASLEGGKVGPRADVYALGAVLYHLLCGRPPFTGDPVTVVYRVATSEPEPPSAHRPGLDPALEAIVRKAMARRPEDRYATAKEFADALGDWLAGPAPTPAPIRRRPRSIGAIAAAALVVGLALAGTAIYLKTRDGTVTVNLAGNDGQVFIDDRPQPDLDGKPVVRLVLKPGRHRFSVRRGDREVYGTDFEVKPGEVIEWGVEVPPAGKDPGLPPTIPAADDPLGGLSRENIPAAERFDDWQPPGLVAVFGTHAWRHWGATPDYGFAGPPSVLVTFAADGRGVIAMDRGGAMDHRQQPQPGDTVRVWDAATGRRLHTFPYPRAQQMCYLPELRAVGLFAPQGAGWTLRLWNIDTAAEVVTIRGAGAIPWTVCASPDGKRLVTVYGQVTVWDLASGNSLGGLPDQPHALADAAFGPDGKTLAVACSTQDEKGHTLHLRLYDTTTLTEVKSPPPLAGCLHFGRPYFAPDGAIYLGVRDGKKDTSAVRRYDPVGKAWREYPDVRIGEFTPFALSRDGKRLVTGAGVFDTDGGKMLVPLDGLLGGLRHGDGIAFSPDGKRVAGVTGDGLVLGYDVETGRRFSPLKPEPFDVLAVTPDGTRMVVRDLSRGHRDNVGHWDDSAVRVVEAATGKEFPSFGLPPGRQIVSAVISPDGKRVVTLATPGPANAPEPDRPVSVWDADARTVRLDLPTTADRIALAPGGRWLATARAGGPAVVEVWDLADTRKPRAVTTASSLPNGSMTVSADGSRVAVIVSGWAWVTKADKNTALSHVKGLHPYNVCALSPDGTRLAFAGLRTGPDGKGEAYECFIQDVEDTGKDVPGAAPDNWRRLPLENAPTCEGLVFAADGKSVFGWGSGGRVVRWSGADGKVMREWQFPGYVRRAFVTENGKYLFTSNTNGTAYIIRL